MSTHLAPGDRVYFVSKCGLKLRCIVQDSMELKARGEVLKVPVVRDIKRRRNLLRLEGAKGPKIRWIDRDGLHKLPPRRTRHAETV